MGTQADFATRMDKEGFTEIPPDKSTVNCDHPGMRCWENPEKGKESLCDENGHYIIWKDPEERKTAIAMLDRGEFNWTGVRIKQG